VLGWVAERHPQLVKTSPRAPRNRVPRLFSPPSIRAVSEEFYEETIRAKHLLEDITGSGVDGYRAASYSIVRESLWP